MRLSPSVLLALSLIALPMAGAKADLPQAEIYALSETLPPLSYDENGIHKGFSNELLQMMLHESGLHAVIQLKPWSRALREAQQVPNTMLYLTVRTPEREEMFKWIGPALPLPIELFRLGGGHARPYTSLDDAKKAVVAVARDTPGQKMLENLGFVENRNMILTNDEAQSAKLLYAHRVQYTAGVSLFQRYALKQMKMDPELLDSVQVLDDSTQFYFAMQKDSNPQYIARLQAALDKIKQDGRYASLIKRYAHP
ncbi:ABC transporter substrate-binding protein [Chromobacterium sp. IIBBL 290-4]|uniref:substrate-binding periplasmic protein n=1 Tax=Chromobacterium sp. IIBBL 290-4 TaxID=2953890 RepID=UPI0020B73700|nr:transporter substrate-binding domain-containing protein [Chromobacterium sp. IIBBL 290-4]UTH74499.1 transporter substrate-binding domain-containing protein [Chromobacterium sp. IIBBL 290-4]